MNRRLAIVPLLVLPLLVLLAISCNGQAQSTTQQPAQLSPEDQAKQTVTDFLEMCKQGRIQEAIDTYTDHAMHPHFHFCLQIFPTTPISREVYIQSLSGVAIEICSI